LVYVPYIYGHNEPIIRLPITTGAAAGLNISDALYRGICEVVERDAFIIMYLNELSPPLVDLSSLNDDLIETLLTRFRDANLEAYVYDITTDIPIPAFLCLLIDRTGVGPAISVGAKASLNPEEAILGCIEESQQSRHWLRTLKQDKTVKPPTRKTKWENISNLEQRGLLWSDVSMIPKLSFLLGAKKKSLSGDLHNKKRGRSDKLKTCLKILRERNQACYYVDVTTLDVEELGLKVVKVIMPKLQPLYLDERFRYWGGSRLRNVPKILGQKKADAQERLNPIPHPFL
jgi:ribosomal protein S12 methylthiotransferase accessory factor